MNVGLFVILTLIWGSSFILMKEGLVVLSAYQVAALRIFTAGLVLMPMAVRSFSQIPRGKILIIVLSGFIGSFVPAFLFCIAEEHINSSLAGILNALSPLFAIIVGVLFYQMVASPRKITSVLIGFGGLCLLFISKDGFTMGDNTQYSVLIVIATLLYGVNSNLLARHLGDVGSLNIAAVAFCTLAIPSFFILLFSGYFNMPLTDAAVIRATLASAILGIVGTAIAQILFYMLLKRTNVLFSSMVTYTIPFIAIFWGALYGETITILQILCLCIILIGVYMANRVKT